MTKSFAFTYIKDEPPTTAHQPHRRRWGSRTVLADDATQAAHRLAARIRPACTADTRLYVVEIKVWIPARRTWEPVTIPSLLPIPLSIEAKE